MLARLAWLEIRNHYRFFLIFAFNLALGLMGLVTVEGFRGGMQDTFQSRSLTLLGADLEISGRRELNQDALSEVERQLNSYIGPVETKRGIGVYNMMAYSDQTRLVHVRVFEHGFPFYGEYSFQDRFKSDRGEYTLRDDAVWIYPELRTQMGIELGEHIEIGEAKFEVVGIIDQDPQQGFAGMSLAPRVFISHSALERANLIQLGSVVWYSYHFKFLNDSRQLSTQQLSSIEQKLNEPALSVVTPERSGEQMGRVFDYLSDFLGLVSLVALFLASVGLVYLYRSFLSRQRRCMAIYLSLGLKGDQVYKLYFWQLSLLALMGSALGLIMGTALLSIISHFVFEWLNLDLEVTLGFSWSLILKILAVGIIGVWLISIPLLRPIKDVRPLSLIQDSLQESAMARVNISYLSLWVPWLVFYLFLSINVANSWIVGGVFYLVFISVPIFMFPVCLFVLKRIRLFTSTMSFCNRMAVLYASRFRIATTTAFLSLLLASLLLNIIPMIQKGLVEELLGPENTERPALFLFDIQEEQVDEIEQFVSQQGQRLIDLSPMVRGRLQKVNNEIYDRRQGERASTREEEQEIRFRNRGLNLTFRESLNPSEEIVRGELFEGRYDWSSDEIAEVSLEQRYAQRMGLELGDIIEVDVLGLPVEARVTSFRRVRWTSFLPNFFILFQPGLIDDAPKTYLAALAQMNDDQRDQFQLSLFRDFPTISVIDTARLVQRVMELMEHMAKALYFMSFLSFMVGGLVLYSICTHQMESKRKDIVLLKSQGLDYKRLKQIFRREFFFIGLVAAFLGGIFGIFISFIIGHFFFDGVWSLSLMTPLAVLIVISLLCLGIAQLAMHKVLRVPAKSLLEETSDH